MWLVTCATCISLLLCSMSTNNVASAKRILVITVAPMYSHRLVLESLCSELSKRGHELVIITSNPMRNILQNYTEIIIPEIQPMVDDVLLGLDVWKLSTLEVPMIIGRVTSDISINIFNNSEVKKLYRHDSDEKFDAVLIEAITSPSLYALAHRFNAPLIGISTLNIHNFQRYVFGSPIYSSHPSNWEIITDFTPIENSSIWKRLRNLIVTWSIVYYWVTDYLHSEQETAKKYLGNDIPHVSDVLRNMSLFLSNENPVYVFPRPEIPNAVFFTGFHLQKTPSPLPKDLMQFLNGEEFIYVSFGTTIRNEMFPREWLKILVQVFSKLPYKVVWKFAREELPEEPGDNTFVSKWFPQQGVLAHPRIKLFIYQGGCQSTEEAIRYAVPLVGIPFIYEQVGRVHRLVSLGVALHLNARKLTAEKLQSAINQIISNNRYKERMKHISAVYKDQPYDSMENAIWWVEFVMRHKEQDLLRFRNDKPWYQLYDIDIIALLIAILLAAAFIITLIIFQIVRFFV